MGRTCFAGSGVTGAGCKRVVMDYPGPWSSVRFESVCVLLMSFFRGTSIWPLRLPGWRPKKSYSLACQRLGEQRRTNISFARSGSGALVSAGFSTLASLVCPTRSFFALPPFPYPVSAYSAAGHKKGDPFRGRPLRRSSVVALLLGLHSVKSGLDRGRCMWGGDRCADIRPGAGEGACLLEYS